MGEEQIRREGARFIASFPPDEPVMSMVTHGGRVYVATRKMVYVLGPDDVLRPIRIEEAS